MARITLKPLSQQVVVLTGGTSGIGLVAARALSERGAKSFLIARNEDALRHVRDELRRSGGEAEYAVADVAQKQELDAAAAAAVAAFGRYDTWVNDAGAFIYGRLDSVSLEDQRRLFDVTYWGMVHGTLIAAEHLKHAGGAIINVGSVLGEIAIPYQGAYCAAKFAIKGFTEAFRREADAARHPISLTLIKPAAINTPFTDHARNRMNKARDAQSATSLRPSSRGACHCACLRKSCARLDHRRCRRGEHDNREFTGAACDGPDCSPAGTCQHDDRRPRQRRGTRQFV